MISYIEKVAGEAARDYIRSDAFRDQIRKHLRWAFDGFAPGYSFKDREAFTATVADRICDKARDPVYLFGRKIWRRRVKRAWAEEQAEQMVEEFLKDSSIVFGEPGFYWGDGHEIADEYMSYWEAA